MTGGNQGIGYYFAKQALNDGHCVAVLDKKTDCLEKLSQHFPDSLLYYQVDVREDRQIHMAITDIIRKFHHIDIAIHNACLCPFGKEIDTDISAFQNIFDVNYYGALRLSKNILPYMLARQTGKIIFTSSGVGVTGFPGITPYASSKGALETLAKCLNLEYAAQGISFHLFHPPLPVPYLRPLCQFLRDLWLIRRRLVQDWQNISSRNAL